MAALWIVRDFYIGPVAGIGVGSNVHLLDADSALIGSMGGNSGQSWQFTDYGFEAPQMLVTGATEDEAHANAAAIGVMLNRAAQARGVYGRGEKIILSMRLSNDEWRYLDVTGGFISPVRSFPDGRNALVSLALECLPFARGDAYPATLTPGGTFTNGLGAYGFIENIPGDAPALIRPTLADASTGTEVVNGVHLWTVSGHGMAETDYVPAVEMVATGSGTAVTDGTSYSGANFARLVANGNWRTIAAATKPTGDDTHGLVDVWLRIRESTEVSPAPSDLAASLGTGIAQVQEKSAEFSGSGIASFSITPNQTTSEGNLLVMVVGSNLANRQVSSISPGTWQRANDGMYDAYANNSGLGYCEIWYSADAASIAGAITVTPDMATSSTTHSADLYFAEYSGMRASSVVDDVAAPATGESGTPTTNSVTTTQANDLLVAAFYEVAGNNLTFSGSFTPEYADDLAVATSIPTAAGTYSTAWNNSGEYAATLAAFKGASATAPNLTAGTYTFRIVPVSSGIVGQPSDPITVVVAANQAVNLSWTAPVSESPTSYRVYWNRGAGWSYLDTGSSDTSYGFGSETGGIAGIPGADTTELSQFRLRVSLSDGTTLFTTDAFRAEVGAWLWHAVYAATVPLPPLAALDGEIPDDWRLEVQGRHPSLTPNLDVDIAWLPLHTDPQVIAEYPGLALGTKRDWVLDTRRDGVMTARLYQTGTTTTAGQPDVTRDSRLVAGPGNALVGVRLIGASGGSDVDNLKATLSVDVTPRWRIRREVV